MVFWKKRDREAKPSDHEVIGGLIQSFINNGDFDPVFIFGFKREEDADALEWERLPLIYLWNEHLVNGDVRFSLSVNGPLVGAMLEAVIPRESPRFAPLRDNALETIRDISLRAVLETCSKTGMKPSELFSK